MSEPIPISLVAHTVFCGRRAWLEAAGENVPSLAIEQGVADHAGIDARSDERARQRRSVDVSSEDLGIVGRCDVVDVGDDGSVEIVEFKSAPLRKSAEVTEAQRVQLALQRLCLEATGRRVTGQRVYFTTSRQTVPVDLSADDMDRAAAYVTETRAIVESTMAPPPLVEDPRCRMCSHVSICLPDERISGTVRRRIVVPDPHGEILHVTIPGARVSLRRGRVVISQLGVDVRSLPVERI